MNINEKKYQLNSNVVMKKPHACGTNLWTVTRLGADIKISCCFCGRTVMLSRIDFEKNIKKVEQNEN